MKETIMFQRSLVIYLILPKMECFLEVLSTMGVGRS